MKPKITLKNIELCGKHAEIIEKISVTQDSSTSLPYDKPPLFDRMLDSFFIAGLVGIFYNKKGVIDERGSRVKTIFSDTVYRNINDINFYDAISIIKQSNLEKTSNIKLAFYSESDEEGRNYPESRFKIFYYYALGGLEIIDKEILQKAKEDESETDIFIRLNDFLEEIEGTNNTPDIDIEFDLDLNNDDELSK